VLPRSYEIALDARLGSDQFQGNVAIQLEIVAPTDRIELHDRELQITVATLALGDASEDAALSGTVTLDPPRELAVIQFSEELPAGPATLRLTYTGTIASGLEGLFFSKDGPDELLATQCETTGARGILPCFDEPIFKATFAWQVTTAPGATVLSNGRLLESMPSADGSSVTWRFAPTKPMSTYLLALTIGDLASSDERVVNGIPLRIWALRGKEAMGRFGLDYTARLLPYYEDYFAAPYHFDKLDQVGVPAFGAGAMENAGLIVSQQIALLLDQESASPHQEMLVAMVIAHEFAHMWFGDLVTMKWWDDLWLNEAFASWMAYHAVETLTPQYRIWDEVQRGFDQALETDALLGTHSIYNPVESPHDTENFDIITYEKGAAVLRMVHDFLGDEPFRAGLRTYMAEFAEGNASGADLWRHLQQASHQPVGQMMESWVRQAGHPLLEVALEDSGQSTALRLGQRRFISGGRTSDGEQAWQVPVTVRYEDDTGTREARMLLGERSQSFPLPVEGELRWAYANAGEIGFYRQQLDAALLHRLLAHLDRLTPAEQKGLLRDQWALTAAGSQPVAAYLDVLGRLAQSDDQTLVGQIVGTHLRRVERLLEQSANEQALVGFRAWVDGLFKGKLAALGFEPRPGEPVAQAQLRAYVLEAMTHFAHDGRAIAQARAWQEREAVGPAAVDPNLAAVFVDTAAEFGDAATYERYLQIFEQRRAGGFSPQQVERYSGVFGRFQQPELAARTIELLGGDTFPFQAMLQNMATMLAQRATERAAWEFLKSSWPTLQQRAPFVTPFVVEFSGSLPPSMRDEVMGFWDATLHGEQAGPLARAKERMDESEKLLERTRAGLSAYFDKSTAAASPAAPTGATVTPSASASPAGATIQAENGAKPANAPADSAAAPTSGTTASTEPTAAPVGSAAQAPAQSEGQPRKTGRGLFSWFRRGPSR
jgi:puromycin-sensitive aminopeptidase